MTTRPAGTSRYSVFSRSVALMPSLLTWRAGADETPRRSALLRLVGVGGDLHVVDVIGIVHGAVSVGVALLDGDDGFHALSPLAEVRVIALELRHLRADVQRF